MITLIEFYKLYTQEILAAGALVFVLLLFMLVFFYKRSRSASHKITVALQPYAQDQIKDIIIPDGVGGLLEIEHLVLLEHGLLLIKTYPFSGNLFAAENIDQWTQVVDGKSFKFVNPLNHIHSTRLALKTLAPNIPIFCRIIFTADSMFPKGKPDEVSTLSSLVDDLQIINNSPKIAEKVQQSWQSIVQITHENSQAIKYKVMTMSTKPLVVAISSRALFDLDESHQIYKEQGTQAYCQYQTDNEDVPLESGAAYTLVKKLLALNTKMPKHTKVEIILLSRNSSDTGLRIFNSIQHHKLDISRAVFTSGSSPYRYVAPFGANLFLSTSSEDVRKALDAGIAAATILPSNVGENSDKEQLRIAFDGDAVLFSDESERIYKEQGLQAFTDNEQQTAKKPLSGGPFKDFLMALNHLQTEFGEDESPIRTALVTARSAPAHERVIRTLRAWNIRIDEAIFLGGMDKGPFLKSFGADIFFDDQQGHCDSAREHVATGHVPHGIANEKHNNSKE